MPRKKRQPGTILPLRGIAGSVDLNKVITREQQRQVIFMKRLAAAIEQQNHVQKFSNKNSFNLKEAVEYLCGQGKTHYKERTLERYVEEGKITVRRTPGNQIRFSRSTLDDLA